MPLSFRFFLIEGQGDISGYDMGHTEIANHQNIWTSIGKEPDESMMIFLSIVDLLDGVRGLLQNNQTGQFEWFGTDSSFSVFFVKNSTEEISVMHSKELIAKVYPAQLAESIYRAAMNFLEQKENQLKSNDPVFQDLTVAKADFLHCIKGLRAE